MIISKTPFRISFFGGGTDLPSFAKRESGCVISSAISKYIYLVVNSSFDELHKLAYSTIEHVPAIEEIKHTRIREIMKRVGITHGIEIHSIGEVPAGTGLGSSSTFTVGLLNALYAYTGRFISKTKLAEEACEVEINNLNEPIGKQDQYAATFGGMNFIQFNTDGSVIIEPIKTSKELIREINHRLLTFYLGTTRDSSKVLTEQNKNVESDKEKFKVLKKMKEITLDMRSQLDNNNINNFGKQLHRSWLLKKSLATSISNTEIDNIYNVGLAAGATGGKISGAGGGGFISFYCEPEHQARLRKALSNFRELKYEFDFAGTRVIYAQ